MEKTIIETVKLTADEGMTLTNGDAYGKVVYLAVGTSPDSWHEIPDSEAEALQRVDEATVPTA